jgi:hypothetical protein
MMQANTDWESKEPCRTSSASTSAFALGIKFVRKRPKLAGIAARERFDTKASSTGNSRAKLMRAEIEIGAPSHSLANSGEAAKVAETMDEVGYVMDTARTKAFTAGAVHCSQGALQERRKHMDEPG